MSAIPASERVLESRAAKRAPLYTVAVAGIFGPLLLAAYFTAPIFSGWPFAGSSPTQLMVYALAHQSLFYAGAWLQVTGTLLCVVFFVALVLRAGAISQLSGLLVVVASTTLLALVLVEAVLLAAVPMAASAGDAAAVSTTFELSNGVFVRVFPLAPASVSYIGLGAVILSSSVLHRGFGYAAFGLGIAFELSGLLAVFTSLGLFIAIALSAGQELWILAAAVAYWRSIPIALAIR